MSETLTQIGASLQTGLPVLLLHFVVTLILLGIGVACYMGITPLRERDMVAQGNAAGGLVLGANIVSLAIPLAATLATSGTVIEIVIWGVVALILQLLAFGAATLFFRRMRAMIEAGNIAAAIVLAGIQVAVALLNAGLMAG